MELYLVAKHTQNDPDFMESFIRGERRVIQRKPFLLYQLVLAVTQDF